ncbi:MAG: hypothetical protein OXH70_17795 [Acidobacteria bacterium]|nr:hypothetical protein [Acidobacteriota bacterium]
MAVGGLSITQCVGAQIFYGGDNPETVATGDDIAELGSVVSWSESPNRATGGASQNDSAGRTRSLPATTPGELASLDAVVNFLPGSERFREIYLASRKPATGRVWLDFRMPEIPNLVNVDSTARVAIATTGLCTFSVKAAPAGLALGQSLHIGTNFHEVVNIIADTSDANAIGKVYVRAIASQVAATAFSVSQAPMSTSMNLFQVLTAPSIGDMTSDENAVYRGTISVQPAGDDWPMMVIPTPS